MAESAEPLVSLFEHILRLKRLPRTGWLIAGVTPPESVADHSLGTALITCFLGEAVNARNVGAPTDGVVDVGRAARMALVHDLAESMVGDLPREATDLLGRESKHAAEKNAMRTLLRHVAGGDDYVALWLEYVAAESAEARIVHDADKLEMVMQASHYASTGNANLDEFWQGHEWHYDTSRDLFEQLLSEAKR